jgi:peptide/nickel transport system substrate-binding protein
MILQFDDQMSASPQVAVIRKIWILFTVCIFTFYFSHVSEAVPANTIVLTLNSDPKSFNALTAKETSTTAVTSFLFQGLIRFNPETGKPEGLLASHWETSTDGLAWTFHLRPDICWSDGKPFTAGDVVFTFNDLIYNPKIINGSRDIFLINGKKVVVSRLDDLTVRFELPSAFAPFLMSMEQAIFPRHILEKAVAAGTFQTVWGIGERPERIVGTGPFQLSRYVPGERVELARNPYYWKKDGKGNRLPYLDRMTLLILPSQDGRLLKFMEGETDAYSLSGKDYPVLAPLGKQKHFKLYELGPGLSSQFIVFNQNFSKEPAQRWFSNRNFRRAVAYAIHRLSMIDIVYNHLGVTQCGPLSPSVPGFYNPNVPCYNYDPAKARQLLAEEGFSDQNGDGYLEDRSGRRLEFVLMSNPESQVAPMIQEDLAQIGIKVNLLMLEFNTIVSRVTGNGDWEAAFLATSTGRDPHFGANIWRSSGNLHFWNRGPNAVRTEYEKQVDILFEQGLGTLDFDRRKAIYDQWQRLTAEELPVIYTILPQTVVAVRDRFENLRPTVISGTFHNIEEIKVKSQ